MTTDFELIQKSVTNMDVMLRRAQERYAVSDAHGHPHYCYECGEKHYAVNENGLWIFYDGRGSRVSYCVKCSDRLTPTQKVENVLLDLPYPIGAVGM